MDVIPIASRCFLRGIDAGQQDMSMLKNIFKCLVNFYFFHPYKRKYIL